MRCGILGASGFIGLQLLDMLKAHPDVTAIRAFSRSYAGKPMGAISIAYKHRMEDIFESYDDAILSELDALFVALPHGTTAPYIRAAREKGVPVVDLSADFRIADPDNYSTIHGIPHPDPDLLSAFTQVCPDINGRDANGKLCISVPGCTASAAILALYPLLADKLIAGRKIIFDAKVSSSGAGISASAGQSHVLRTNGVRIYKLLKQHRHVGETESFLRQLLGQDINLQMSISSIDMTRGISGICYYDVPDGTNTKDIARSYRRHYSEKACVRLIKQHRGVDRYPNPLYAVGTNFCDIGYECAEDTGDAVSVVSIDNLIRGGAGQAVQSFNYQHGLDPDHGLPMDARFP